MGGRIFNVLNITWPDARGTSPVGTRRPKRSLATSTNGELLNLSGLRNPYPGNLGVVEERAFADFLLVDGNPLENISLIADPKKNFLVIMKDGRVYKIRIASPLGCRFQPSPPSTEPS